MSEEVTELKRKMHEITDNEINTNKTGLRVKDFLDKKINLFQDYFEFDFKLYNELKETKKIKEFKDYFNGGYHENPGDKNAIIEIERRFNGFKNKYNNAKKNKKPPLSFELLFLQPFFENIYEGYFKIEGIKGIMRKNPPFHVFFRNTSLDFEDKTNKILFEIKRNHKNANFGWFNSLAALIQIRASNNYSPKYDKYLPFMFMIDIEHDKKLSVKENELLTGLEIYYFRLYKENGEFCFDTNLDS